MRTLREYEADLPLKMRALDKHCDICATFLAMALNDKKQHVPLYIANLYRHYDKAHLRNCRLGIKKELWQSACSHFRKWSKMAHGLSDIERLFKERYGEIGIVLYK